MQEGSPQNPAGNEGATRKKESIADKIKIIFKGNRGKIAAGGVAAMTATGVGLAVNQGDSESHPGQEGGTHPTNQEVKVSSTTLTTEVPTTTPLESPSTTTPVPSATISSPSTPNSTSGNTASDPQAEIAPNTDDGSSAVYNEEPGSPLPGKPVPIYPGTPAPIDETPGGSSALAENARDSSTVYGSGSFDHNQNAPIEGTPDNNLGGPAGGTS